MKRIININVSKDTSEEVITALSSALKMGKEKSSLKVSELYILNEDIEKLHERYEQLFKQVKTSLNLSVTQIEKECEILSLKYDFEIKELSKLRKVDYDKEQAKIKAREAEQRPWRRCWLWRLLFSPLTNRAQDIIEERAEVEADIIHTAEERAIEEERKKLSKRDLTLEMREKLNEAIKIADNAPVQEAFEEPKTEPVQEPSQIQLNLSDLPRPRPPRSCRRPPTPKQ